MSAVCATTVKRSAGIAENVRMLSCKDHPAVHAFWYCSACDLGFCDECILVRRYGRSNFRMCKACTDLLMPLDANASSPEDPSLWSAFTWPFRGEGPMMLLAGVIGFGIVGYFSSLLVWGLMLGYGMTIIEEAARGRHEPPDWPDVTGLGDLLWPAFLALGVAALTFGPAVWLTHRGAHDGLILGALALGAVYAPMAWIAASVSRRLLGITPLGVFPLLFRAHRSYWAGCAMLFVGLIGIGLVRGTLEIWIPGFVSPLFEAFMDLYFVMVQMRILGIVWWRHRHEFALE